MEIPRLDIDQRIGDSFVYFFKFRLTDGTLRSFTGSTAIFHAQSGVTTIHISSADPDSGIEIMDVPTEPGGGVGCGIYVRIPWEDTEDWSDQQKFFYELEEWTTDDRFTLIDGVITATIGVVDGSD